MKVAPYGSPEDGVGNHQYPDIEYCPGPLIFTDHSSLASGINLLPSMFPNFANFSDPCENIHTVFVSVITNT